MALTTKENVLEIAPELSEASDALWTMVLNDATNNISSSVFGNKTELAARNWVAHYMTIYSPSDIGNSSGPVTKYKVGDVTIEYANINKVDKQDKDYGRTKYGRTFLSIRNACIPYFHTVIPGV